MLQGLSGSILLLCGVFYPNFFSIIYVVFGILIWFATSFSRKIPESLFRAALIFGLISLVAKIAILLMLNYSALMIFSFTPKSTIMQGVFFYETNAITYFFKNFSFDILAIICLVISLRVRKKLKYKQYFKFRIEIMWIGLVILAIYACSYITLANFIYSLTSLVYAANLRYKSMKLNLVIFRFISIISAVQIAMSYILALIYENQSEREEFWIYGFISNDLHILPMFLMTFIVHLVFTFFSIAYKQAKHVGETASDMQVPLIPKENETETSLKETSFDKPIYSNFLNNSPKELLFHMLARLMAIMWTIYFRNILSILLMIPLFYTIISTSKRKTLLIYRLIVIPLQFIGFGFSYCVKLYANSPSYNDLAAISYLFVSTMFFLILVRLPYVRTEEKYSRKLRNLFSFWYLFSLFGIMLAALSDINYIQGIIILFYFIFLIIPSLIEKYWKWLVIYSMTALLFSKIFNVFPSLASYILLDNYKIETFGISLENKDRVIYLNEIILWIIVILSGIQLWVNKSSHKLNSETPKNEEEQEDKKLVKAWKKIVDNAINWIKRGEIWLCILLMFTFILFSIENVINFIRFILAGALLILLRKPIKKPYNRSADQADEETESKEENKREENQPESINNPLVGLLSSKFPVKSKAKTSIAKSPPIGQETKENFKWHDYTALWVITYVFMCFSAVILIVEYIYQFWPFLQSYIWYIGLNQYDEENIYTLYSTITLDSLLFISSRYTYHSIIRQQESSKLAISELIKTYQFRIFCECFNLALLFTIFYLSCYWKLSCSMLLYLIVVIIYFVAVCIYLNNKNRSGYGKEWNYRHNMWKALFTITILALIFSYTDILLQPFYLDEPSELIKYTEWIFYFAGFSATKKWSIFDNYGYVVICILLIIERHCLEYLKPNYDATYLTGLLKINTLKINKKVNLAVVRILTWLRTISEVIIPILLLFTAFKKLTIIGFVYLLTVLFVPLAKKSHQKVIICIIAAIMMILQYSLILSNINGKNSPQTSYAADPFGGAWYPLIDWPTKDDAYFLSLGTELSQLHSLIYDGIIILLCLFHFVVLSNERDKLKELEGEKGEFAEAKHEENETDKLKSFMDALKKNILRFSRLLLLFLILLFRTKSFGLISLVYIFFSLLLIIKETTLVKSNLPSYTRILSYLLIYTLLDLTIQFIFQIPFKAFDNYKDENLFKVIGVKRLWSAGANEGNSDNYASSQLEIDMKILIFSMMYVIYRMINSQEFLVYFGSLSKENLRESIGVGIEKARLFNNELIEKTIKYDQRRAIFADKLEKLENQLNLIRKNAATNLQSQKPEIDSNKIEKESQLTSFKNKFDRILISMVDITTFRKFILHAIERNSKMQNIDIELKDLGSQPQKTLSAHDKQPKEDDDLNLEDESSPVEVYNLTFTDYIKLLLIYIPASNTQNLVFFMCFLNNFMYASLESVILPISIVGYAMFENPRPPSRYFWLLLYYASMIVFIKFCFQLDLWPYLTTTFPINYYDPAKIGFNLAKNTHSGTFFWYIFYDALLIVTILFHTYYLRRVGLYYRVEYEIESFEQAKLRYAKQVNNDYESLELKTRYPYQMVSGSICGKFVKLVSRIIPKNKEEKPGKDLYLPMILIQLVILVYIFICFTRMEGISHDISQSIKSNQFQGRMVIALVLQFFFILIERYLYVRKTSQALRDDQVASLERKDTLLSARKSKSRESTKSILFLPSALSEEIEFDRDLIHRQFKEAENSKNVKVTWIEGDHEIVQWKVVFIVETINNSKDKKIEATIIFPFQYPKYPPKLSCKKNIHHKIVDDYENSIIPEFINQDWKSDQAIYNILNQIWTEFNYEPAWLEKSSEKTWNRAMLLRLFINVMIMVTIHALVFWYFPIDGNLSLSDKSYCKSFDKRECNDFQINAYIEWFYILFVIYFVIMSLQIRHGLPSFIKISFPFMRSTSSISNKMFKLYLALPFLYEIRTLLDWTFTPTALDLFQWFKFEDINAKLYQTRCTQQNYSRHKKGEKIAALQKGIMGFFTLFLICFVILIPLILFSSLNPIMEQNDVKWMELNIKIIADSRSYTLYQTKSHDEMHFIRDGEWKAKNFSSVKDILSSDKPHLQIISLPRFQETYWGITPPSMDDLCISLNKRYSNPENKLMMSYTFWRTYPTAQPGVSQTLSIPLEKSTIKFNEMICQRKFDANYTKTNFYGSFLKLPSVGNAITPYNVIDERFSPNLYMKLHRDDRNSSYWEVAIFSDKRRPRGLVFYVISDSYSPITFGFSLMAFYISIVYLIARFLRFFVIGGSQNIYMTEMKNPLPLITLCSGVYVCRMRGQLVKEEELYYELIDILRSTEQVKSMTGTSSIKEKMD